MGFAKTAEPFVCGGSAATFASVIIHPIDLAKVCFTSFVGWKRLICAATHGTQCTYVSRPGRHKVPAMIGRKVPVASLGDGIGGFVPKILDGSLCTVANRRPLRDGHNRTSFVQHYFAFVCGIGIGIL